MVVAGVVVVVAGGMLTFMRSKAQNWADKWVNMGKVRIVYTTFQVITCKLNLTLLKVVQNLGGGI